MKKFLFLSFLSIFLFSCSTSDKNSGTSGSSGVLKVETYSISNITFTSAKCIGIITYGQDVLQETGVCWSTSQNPTISGAHAVGTLNTGNDAYTSTIGPLAANTTYYVRTYAKDNSGVVYSSQTLFSTLSMLSSIGGGVTDIEGKTYGSVVINGKEWMQKNLDVSKYKNGNVIPQVTSVTQWDALTTGAWCYYENDTANGPVYGKLYNWYAVNDPRGLAPTGWHIPTDTEWSSLAAFLGGESGAGRKLKDDSPTYWEVTNNSGINQTGFTALPAGTGYLNYHNTLPSPTLADLFKDKTKVEYWWSATANGDLAYSRDVRSSSDQLSRSGLLKKSAISVRCVKD